MTHTIQKNIASVEPLTIGLMGSEFLDLLRACAALAVLAAHASQLILGVHYVPTDVPVIIFFYLSGFLITLSILRLFVKDGRHFARYLSDRIARIYVPLLPLLAVVAIVNYFWLSGHHFGSPGVSTGPYTLLFNFFLLSDYPPFQAISRYIDITNFYPRPYNSAEPLWTVAIEFWIYVFIGVVAFVVIRKENIRPFSVILLVMVSFPIFVWNSFAGGGNFLTLIWLLGSVAALLYVKLNQHGHYRLKNKLGIGLLIYGIVCLPPRLLEVHGLHYDLQVSIFIGMIIFGSLLVIDRFNPPEAMRKVIQIAASYSYSLYLTHNTIVTFLVTYSRLPPIFTFILAIVLANCVAIVFYLAFERHHRAISFILRPYVEKLLYSPISQSSAHGQNDITMEK